MIFWHRILRDYVYNILCFNDHYFAENVFIELYNLVKLWRFCPTSVYLRNEFHFSEVYRSVNYTGSRAK